MKGLILKDLKVSAKQIRFLGLVMIVYFVIGVASGQTAIFTTTSFLLTITLPITALSYDERSKWDGYALTMAVSRTTVALSKYVLTLIYASCVLVLNCLFSLAVNAGSIHTMIITNLTTMAIALIVFSLIMPFLYHFGTERGRIIMIVMCVLPMAAVLIFGEQLGRLVDGTITSEQLLLYALIAAVILFALSAMISAHIYKKKEF